MPETKTRIHLFLDPALLATLRDMAATQHRSLSGQINFMLDSQINAPAVPLDPVPPFPPLAQ